MVEKDMKNMHNLSANAIITGTPTRTAGSIVYSILDWETAWKKLSRVFSRESKYIPSTPIEQLICENDGVECGDSVSYLSIRYSQSISEPPLSVPKFLHFGFT